MKDTVRCTEETQLIVSRLSVGQKYWYWYPTIFLIQVVSGITEICCQLPRNLSLILYDRWREAKYDYRFVIAILMPNVLPITQLFEKIV